jgi:alpha/beta superfamily hydrolase
MYDFSFLAPCPSSGLIVNGEADRIAPQADIEKLAAKLRTQKGITVTHVTIPGANHFFDEGMDAMVSTVEGYMRGRLAEAQAA